MKVPTAQQRVGIGRLQVPQASAESFGAGTGRAMEQAGRQVEQTSDLIVQMRNRKIIRDATNGYSQWTKEANRIYQEEVLSRQGADVDALDGEGFRNNFTSKLDAAFDKISDGYSGPVRDRMQKMTLNQRIAIETRAANHVFTQMKEAEKQSAELGLESAVDSYAVQARQYTQKLPDGTVQMDWKEIERVMPDVISAQKLYNSRHGISSDVEQPDGTKKNILGQSARAQAHRKAIESFLVAGEYDEAEAYLNVITENERYKNDLDEKQVKLTLDTIKKAQKEADQQMQHASNSAVAEFVMEQGRLPNAAERAGMELTPETVKTLDGKQPKMIRPELNSGDPNPEYTSAANSLDYYEFLTRVNNYDKAQDPTGEKIRDMAMEATGFGAGSSRALKEVQEAYADTDSQNKISTESKKAVKRRILNMVKDAIDRKANVDDPPGWFNASDRLSGDLVLTDSGNVSSEKSSGELYELYARLVGFAETLQQDANLTETQYYKAIEEHPVFVQLQDTDNLSSFSTEFFEYSDTGSRLGALDDLPTADDFSVSEPENGAARVFEVDVDDSLGLFISQTGGLYR